jgi:hypothetical protein
LNSRAISESTGWTPTPTKACWTRPRSISCDATSRTVLTGTAKPMPMLPRVLPVAIAVFTPTTRPVAAINGPPELPLLIDASVWMTSSIVKAFGAVSGR